MALPPLLARHTRLEPNPRDPSGADGVQARIADPLWLLARQRQFGELTGINGGSPAWARVQGTSRTLTAYSGPDDTVVAIGAGPLDWLAEADRRSVEDLSDREAGRAGGIYVQMLTQRLDQTVLASYITRLQARYPLQRSGSLPDPFLDLTGGTVPDARTLVPDLAAARALTPPTVPLLPPLDGLDPDAVGAAADDFLAWLGQTAGIAAHGDGASGWAPSRLEYAFSTGPDGAPAEFTAREHTATTLDWAAFDRTAGAGTDGVAFSHSAVPTPVSFAGKPDARFWSIEDAAVSITETSVSADDLTSLLLIDFALEFGNDFFLLPVPVAAGAFHRIDSLEIVDSFGRALPIAPVAVADGDAGPFRLFESTSIGEAREPGLLLFPVLDGVLDGAPVEEVHLVRDDLDERVWGVQVTYPGPSGPVDAVAAAATTRRTTPVPAGSASARYEPHTSIADNWVPLDGTVDATGAISLTLPPGWTPPGALLPYSDGSSGLAEEEVGPAGVTLTRRWRVARDLNGAVRAWLAVAVAASCQELPPALAFDQALAPSET